MRSLWKTRTERARADAWFLITWIVVITLFFSVSQSKLIPYILPVFPAFAVLIGRYIADALAAPSGSAEFPLGGRREAPPKPPSGNSALPERKQAWQPALRGFRIGLRAAALIAIAFAAALIFYPVIQRQKLAELDIAPAWLAGWQTFLGIILGGGGILAAALTTMRRERAALGVLVATFGVFMLSANFVAGPFDARSTKTVSLALRDQLAANPGAEVYTVGDYAVMQDVPVYANRLVNVVDGFNELAFGIAADAAESGKSASRFIKAPEFSQRWRNTTQRAYAIVQKRDLDRYFAALPRTTLAENARYLLLENTPGIK